MLASYCRFERTARVYGFLYGFIAVVALVGIRAHRLDLAFNQRFERAQ